MCLTKEKSFYREFFNLYVPLVLYNIVLFGVNLADNVMIGAYSETALSGVAAVNQIQFIFQQVIVSAGDAVVVLGSQYWGAHRKNEIKHIACGALYVGAGLGLLLFLAATFFPVQLLGLFTSSPEIIAQGTAYLDIIKYTYLFFALTNILLAYLRCAQTVRIGFYISLMSLVINCTINYMLIYGNFGAPELGVHGAAIGTLCARVAEFVVVLLYLFFFEHKLSTKPKELFVANRALFSDYIKIAWRFIAVGTAFGISTALQTVILGHMTDAAIAANSAASTLYQVLKVAATGAASAASVIIGKTLGAAKSRTEVLPRVRSYVQTLQLMFLGIGLLAGLLLFCLRAPILSMYTSLSEEAHTLAMQFLTVLSVTCVGSSYQMPVIVGIIRGGGDARFPLINDFISIWCIVLPLSFCAAFVFHWPPVAVVICLNADQIFKCLPAVIKVNRYRWMYKLTRTTENTV